MSFFLPQLSMTFRTDIVITILTMASFMLSQLKTLRMALINISCEMLTKNENNPKFNSTFLVFFILDYPLLHYKATCYSTISQLKDFTQGHTTNLHIIETN